MADVKSKLQQDITPRPDDAPLFGPVASEAARYLAAIAMTALASVQLAIAKLSIGLASASGW